MIKFLSGNFTLDSFIDSIPVAIIFIIFELLLSPLYVLFLKFDLKFLQKKENMGYSPSAIIEFYEDVLVETTPDNKTELKYSAIERVSIVHNKIIYLHMNHIMSYSLPFSCFESKEQYYDFIKFIKSKFENIDIYDIY